MILHEPGDSCEKCGKWKEQGLAKLRESSKKNPIYGTDLNRPISVLVKEIRNRLTAIRGSIGDIKFAYSGLDERLGCAEGGITCVISALHPVMIEFEKLEQEEKKLTTGP